MRNFNAQDKDGNGLIQGDETYGTFLNGIDKLDEIKKLGVNTLHLLPVNPPGKKKAKGTAGSLYAPRSFTEIDPLLDDPNNPMSVKEEMKKFVEECHKRGIRVMLDLPSCASVSMYEKRPELMAIDQHGLPKVPWGWNDIRMFQPWKNKKKRVLNKELLELHKKFVDLCIEVGVDGIRADVARAKPVEFWDVIIPYSRAKDPEFAWLAESYIYEDASPMKNIPADRPESFLRVGFDAFYGQYHIFHEWSKAKDLHNYVRQNIKMTHRLERGKSLIGSFATHDDISPMSHGGAPYCKMISGLMFTLPMTNPYFLDGFQVGDYYHYPYANTINPYSLTDIVKRVYF